MLIIRSPGRGDSATSIPARPLRSSLHCAASGSHCRKSPMLCRPCRRRNRGISRFHRRLTAGESSSTSSWGNAARPGCPPEISSVHLPSFVSLAHPRPLSSSVTPWTSRAVPVLLISRLEWWAFGAWRNIGREWGSAVPRSRPRRAWGVGIRASTVPCARRRDPPGAGVGSEHPCAQPRRRLAHERQQQLRRRYSAGSGEVPCSRPGPPPPLCSPMRQ